MATTRDKLIKLNIDPNSEMGVQLIALDKVYASIEKHKREIKKLKIEIQDGMETAETMEMILMLKSNQASRDMERGN